METPDEVKKVHKMTEEIKETHKSSLSSHEELQLPFNDKNKFLVIDTGAIVKGQTNLFHQTANRFVTVQEVLGEVRDSKSRELLASLPFELEVRAPSDAAMKIVYDFAKKTGDFAALSLCDIKIMALTYDLEIQNHQKMFIRDAPMRISHSIPPKPQPKKDNRVSPVVAATSEDQPCCSCEEQDYIIREDHHIPDQGLLHEVIGSLNVISIKEVIVQDDQTSSVETLDGSNHDHHQGEATTTAAAAIAAAAREVLEVCSNESIDGSSHQNSETEGDLDNLTEQIHEIQSQLEQEIAKEAPQKVHFHDEEFPVTSVSAEEAPAFDEENFPSLGSVRTPFPAAASASTASSWAKKIAAPPSDSPVIFSNIKLPSKNYVLPSSSAHSQLSSCHTPADTESESTAHDPSSSRIISAGGGVGDYVSKAASTFMEAEDDGIGWINPTNLSGCRTTGEGMLHSQSKTLVKKSTEELAAVATATPAGDTQTETKSLTKSQKRNMKKKARHTAAAAATAAGNATAKEERTEAMVSTGSAQILPEEAPLGFRNLPLPELRSPSVSSSVSSARRGGAVAYVDRLVGCMTTDYAMQNVMLQMGLQVISLDGNVIRTVKQWILRCAGCYQIHYDMSRLFCSHCGLNMLQKISASIDSKTGELRLHLKKNYLPNRRGQVYSLPAPGTQDRFEGELLLREDQLLSGIWKQKVVKIRKDIRSAFGDDITSDVGLQINKGSAIKVGLGKRNPNAEKGRERRGKRKQKK